MANLKKNVEGYGYKYTDLAQINNYVESNGWKYFQEIEPTYLPNEIVDYVVTYIDFGDGKYEKRKCCRVPKATLSGKTNPAQELGSALTYARRYSLLLAFGLATTDDDGACLTVDTKALEKQQRRIEDKIMTLASMKGCEDKKIRDYLAEQKCDDLDAQEVKLDKWLMDERKKKEPEPPKEYKKK